MVTDYKTSLIRAGHFPPEGVATRLRLGAPKSRDCASPPPRPQAADPWCYLDLPLFVSGSEPRSLNPRDSAVVARAPVLQLLQDAGQFHW